VRRPLNRWAQYQENHLEVLASLAARTTRKMLPVAITPIARLTEGSCGAANSAQLRAITINMAFPNLGSLLQQYAGLSPENPPATTEQDFQHVSQTAEQTHLEGGIAEAFRSNQTPAFSQMIGSLFSNSNGEQRAGILSHLLNAAGPSATALLGGLAGLGGGGGGTQITPEQAQQISPDAVSQIAEHAQKNDPSIIERASSFYAQHPTLVQGLGAGSLALIMSHMSRRS
jgi:hypothetical protein